MRKGTGKNFKRLATFFLAAVMMTGVVGCGGGGASTDAGDRTVINYASAYVTVEKRDAYLAMVEAYNNGQGVKDGVYVNMVENTSAIPSLEMLLRSKCMYDVVQIEDKSFKVLAVQGQGYFVPLDKYLTDEVKDAMNWDDIPDNLVNRYRINQKVDENNLYQAGEGAELLALPNGNDPQMLFYNRGILNKAGINIVSVQESELDDYNKKNNATLKPHGYAEYKNAPFKDAKSSENEAGQVVYKVFNECIPMNWEELRCVARAMQKQYGYSYGFTSEWWFNMGWSVGADCIGWNESKGNYEFTLTDAQSNYLALDTIKVNGQDYKKGDVLKYEDKTYINNNESEKSALAGKIYELPSTYNTILEYTRLGVPANKEADPGLFGYGVSPNTVANRADRFLSGQDCPFYMEFFSKANSFKTNLGDNLGMALPTQYREYVGGSTYTSDGTEYLKVIGETYDGAEYTGEIRYEEGTPIVGKLTTASSSNGFFLPTNTENKNYDAAFKFISWAAGSEAQAILAKSNVIVPNQVTYAMSDYAKAPERIIPNMWSGAFISKGTEIGDYAYFTSQTWIVQWSEMFNTDVREGKVTLSQFAKEKKDVADVTFQGMNIKLNGR